MLGRSECRYFQLLSMTLQVQLEASSSVHAPCQESCRGLSHSQSLGLQRRHVGMQLHC
jgi:hypothetical protein